MKLWLLRHGQAYAYAAHDSERALTEQGKQEIAQSAVHLCDQPLDIILSSPFVRAEQSTDQVLKILARPVKIEQASWATPDDNPRAALKYLDQLSDYQNILLVTHQFFVGQLAGLLTGQPPVAFRTGTLLELEGDFIAAGLMSLKHSYHPN
ncbi:phosphohistidine phosphatase SixA [Pseudomonas sp. F1_0610]|uniref:phosphohistidine phosphatase SixA n=1 Tax=Pseudomonas sp. F1_0610 TaxID=3114284 RepID=UPI0039C39471